MSYLLAHVPIYKQYHKNKFVENKLKLLKQSRKPINDIYGEKIEWNIIEEYLGLAYDKKYYGIQWNYNLRISPGKLIHMCDVIENRIKEYNMKVNYISLDVHFNSGKKI